VRPHGGGRWSPWREARRDRFSATGEALVRRRSWLPLMLLPLVVASFSGLGRDARAQKVAT
jgi:hypothetical protein